MNKPVDILLVEDDPVDLELELRALNKHNLAKRLEVVNDGKMALEFIFCSGAYAERSMDTPPRLILLDLKLPLVSGLEVLQAVKSDPRTRTIPVVVLTSSLEERDIVESYNLGVNSYLFKPMGFAQFSEAVAQLGRYWLLMNQPLYGTGK
jgi:two-component system, response regulator